MKKIMKVVTYSILLIALAGFASALAQEPVTLSLWSRDDGQELTNSLVETWNSETTARLRSPTFPPHSSLPSLPRRWRVEPRPTLFQST